MSRKTSATHLHWEAPRSPSSPVAAADQSFLSRLPFKGHWLQQHNLLGVLRPQDDVSRRKVVVVIWLGNFSCRSRSTNSCQSLAEVKMPADVLLGYLLSHSDKGDGFLRGTNPLNFCADGFGDGLKDLVMPPAVSSFFKSRSSAGENVLKASSLETQQTLLCPKCGD